jgi:hypothetical protein
MKIFDGKKMRINSVALLLILAMASSLMILPEAVAQTNVPTYAFISIAPDPIGLGQTLFVNFWINLPPPTGSYWNNFKVTVTKPDGKSQALSLGARSSSDAVGGSWSSYKPAAVGNYTFVFEFPGQTIRNTNYQPSTSTRVTITVQEQQVETPLENPLPSGFWERPVYSVNSEWYRISGNWLGLAASTFAATGMYNASGNFNPYTTAPNSAHIVWTKPEAWGGLIGGEFGGSQQSNYYSTSQYEPKFAPIIMNGILYYTAYPGSSTYPAGWIAVDIRTGETVWTKSTTEVLKCGQTVNYVSPNQYGGLAYLWSVPLSASGFFVTGSYNLSMYDAMTGNKILDIVSAVPMTLTEASDGSLIGYFTNGTGASQRLHMWNSSMAINQRSAMWRPSLNGAISFYRGIMWSNPVAYNISGVSISPALSISKVASDVVLMMSFPNTGIGTATYWQPGWQIEAAYSAIDGHQLWGPLNRTEEPWTRIYMGPAGWDVYTEYVGETMTWKGYSLTTGAELWGPTEPDANAWSYYGVQYVPAYGNFYCYDFGGHVAAYNFQTGEKLWSYNTGSAGYETPYGVWTLWTFSCGTVADGKFFVPEGHMYSPPLFHGAQQLAIDTNTGKLVWSVLAFDVTSAPAIADGYMMTLNAYDNQIYCWGKGKTATTVSAPQTEVPLGSKVLITGTILDQSPDILNTPCINDANMSKWMEYQYMQQPKPTDVLGVPVRLTAVDPSGVSHDIGAVLSDVSGTYASSFTPTMEGVYRIVANFDGTESYFNSEATTYVMIGAKAASPAPTETPTPTQPPTSTPAATNSPTVVPINTGNTGNTALYVGIAAVVIVIVVVAVAFVLRRRK